jgi:hypothetical protein
LIEETAEKMAGKLAEKSVFRKAEQLAERLVD